jgi:hypothetical protein
MRRGNSKDCFDDLAMTRNLEGGDAQERESVLRSFMNDLSELSVFSFSTN